MVKPITRAQVIAAVEGLDKKRRNKKVCDLIGHTNLIVRVSTRRPDLHGTPWDTTYHCARCCTTVEQTDESLVVGSHRTMANRKKFAAMKWRDKLYAPENPFGVSIHDHA